ncbi:ARID DNA-binding domain-containing protein [Tanacetum coccineum]
MVNYKRLLEMNWLRHKPLLQWYQSGRSTSWEKPIHNRMQKGFEKGYLLREGAANTLPRSSQKKLKNSFKVEGTQHERKIIFSHGIGEAMVETSEKKIVIPYKEWCDDETDSATSKEGNGCDVETESMIEKHNKYLEEYFDSIDSKDACPLIKGLEELKWDRNIVQDYLDEDYISVNGTLYAIKVNSFKRFISFLDMIKNNSIVFKTWEVLRKRFEDMINWFYLIYLKQDVLEPLPPVIGNVKIDLLGLYKMVHSMGGYLSVSFRNRWKEVAVIHRLTKAHEEDLKAYYKRTIDMVKFCYDTTLRPWFKEEPMKCEKTKKVEGDYDHAKEENPQEHDGSSNNDTDVDQMADQEDGANTSETYDFVMLRRKLNEIEAYNASKGRAAVKEKREGGVNTTKEKRARCYICRKRGYVFWKCPNKKNSTTLEAPTIDNQSKEPTMVRNKEILKYPENVHVKTDYMIKGTYFLNWDNIWYVTSAYKKHISLTKSLFKRLKNSFKVEETQHERKIIFSHGIGEAMVETSEKKIVIPYVLYILEITLNVLSLDQLMAQGFVVTYGHNNCQISYMFEEDKEGCDGETNCVTSKEGNGYDVETKSMIAKHNKYLEEYIIY